MLTKITAYSPWLGVDPLVLNVINLPDTDLFEVRNIDGLGPVNANINTTQLGSLDKEVHTGSNVGKRNIVFTLGLRPDWDAWTVSKLRRHLDNFFMSKQTLRLVFESMEFSPVEIFGHIESNEPNMFSKDPEQVISIICPDPDFIGVDEVIVDGQTDETDIEIPYNGNVPTGFHILVNKMVGSSDVHWLNIKVGDPDETEFKIDLGSEFLLNDMRGFIANTIPGDKYVRRTSPPDPGYFNLLNYLTEASEWPSLKPGVNPFQIISDAGVQFWYMTYYERFRSL